MATQAEIDHLRKVRDRLSKIGRDWSIDTDGETLRLCVADPVDGTVDIVATLSELISFANQDFLIHAASDIELVVDLLDRCIAAHGIKPKKKPADYAANCVMMCKSDQAFRQYLIERHDLTDASDFERIKVRMRSILNVASIGELNSDPNAAARWKDLVGSFYVWRQRHAAGRYERTPS